MTDEATKAEVQALRKELAALRADLMTDLKNIWELLKKIDQKTK